MLAQLTSFARGGSGTSETNLNPTGAPLPSPPATSNSASSLLRSLASAASNSDKQRKKSPGRKARSEMSTATEAEIALAISPITPSLVTHTPSGTQVSPRSVSPRSRSSSISEAPFPPFIEASLIISLKEMKGLMTTDVTDFVVITKLCGHKFRSKQYTLHPGVEFRDEHYPFKVRDPTVPVSIAIYKVDEKGERTKRLGKCIPTLADNAMRLVKVTSDCWWSVQQQFQNQKSQAYIRILLDYDVERKHRENHGLRKKAASAAVLPAHKRPESKHASRGINSLNVNDPDHKQRRLVKEKSAKDMMQLFHSFKLEQQTLMKTWAINQQELIFEEEVAEGVSAKVFKGKYRDQAVAIKVLRETLGPKEQADFEKEFELLMNLRSLHIVFFYGICFKPQTCIVLEWCEHGSLYDYMKAKQEMIDWSLGLRYMIEIVRALNTLHTWKPPIVHRDLKSQNVLVADNLSLKICDLGLARSALPSTDNMATLGKVRGTFQYTAPELYAKQQYTAKADMYSTAVIFWEIATRVITCEYQQPFSEYKHLKFDFQIYLQVVKQNLRPTIPPSCPPGLRALIAQCWDVEPEKRPTTSEVLVVLQQLKEDYLKNKLIWDATISTPHVELEDDLEHDDQPPSSSSSSSLMEPANLTASAPV